MQVSDEKYNKNYVHDTFNHITKCLYPTALETLASQIRSSTGSMKLIEEQLNLRYRTAELAKEGQLEARERLIRDMEDKAKQRAELAEAEAFR